MTLTVVMKNIYLFTSEPRIDCFVYEHELHNLAKERTCFKSVQKPSCIDLILTNNAMAFQNTTTAFTSLSVKVNLKKLLTEAIKILIMSDLMMR